MIAVSEVIHFIKFDIINVFGVIQNKFIKYLKPIDCVDEYTLDWISKHKNNKQQAAEQSKAKVILCDPSICFSEIIISQGKVLIHVNNPKIEIALIADRFFAVKPSPGIHNSAYIDPKANISKLSYIGPNCFIGNCTIGSGTLIYPNVTIYDGVVIGKNVIVQAGAVIGTDGLGCERKEDGTLVKFSHLAGVVIDDNVEIGANCQIARGALSNTVIGYGTKINGLCFIAHNCILGKNVLITGNSMLAGSVKVEDNVTIYSRVVVREQRTIGEGAVIGMGAVVITDIPPGETWMGNPAKRYEK